MNRQLVKHTVDESLNPVVLLLGLEADEVHATFPAVVPGIEPIPLSVPKNRNLFQNENSSGHELDVKLTST